MTVAHLSVHYYKLTEDETITGHIIGMIRRIEVGDGYTLEYISEDGCWVRHPSLHSFMKERGRPYDASVFEAISFLHDLGGELDLNDALVLVELDPTALAGLEPTQLGLVWRQISLV